MVRDRFGKKMSKSFGNVIDPLQFMDEYGADALRFALFQHCSPGADIPLADEWVEGAKRYANKLWNATRFALGNLDGPPSGELPDGASLALEDRWILSRLAATHEAVDRAYDGHDWAAAADALHRFSWHELADWYLEVAKVRLGDEGTEGASVARAVLGHVVDTLLKLLHPLMPFVTEALWRHLTRSAGGRDSLMVQAWPETAATRDEVVEARFGLVQDLVTELRRFRSEHDVPRSKRFALAVATDAEDLLAPAVPLIETLAGLDSFSFESDPTEDGHSKIVFTRGTAYVPQAGLIDLEEERSRLDKELAQARGHKKRVEGKLGNEKFVSRAPADVVAKERERLEHWTRVESELESQLSSLG